MEKKQSSAFLRIVSILFMAGMIAFLVFSGLFTLIRQPVFSSCYENRLDTKGRISVPAAFRSSLNNENFSGVVLYRSFTHNCIEGVSMSRMEKIANATDQMEMFDGELDDLSALVFADARPLLFDVTGRIIIPADL